MFQDLFLEPQNLIVFLFSGISFLCIFPKCAGDDSAKLIGQCSRDECDGSYFMHNPFGPQSPMVPCKLLDLDFLTCAEPLDLKKNETAREELGYGCTKFGGQRFEDVQFTAVNCSALPGIECYGPRTFLKEGFPCIKYTGHYFGTTLLYSVLLGFLGMDRFCLGHTGTAVGKLLTLGGVGIWWIVDVVLLVTGNLMPEDGSNWVPYA